MCMLEFQQGVKCYICVQITASKQCPSAWNVNTLLIASFFAFSGLRHTKPHVLGGLCYGSSYGGLVSCMFTLWMCVYSDHKVFSQLIVPEAWPDASPPCPTSSHSPAAKYTGFHVLNTQVVYGTGSSAVVSTVPQYLDLCKTSPQEEERQPWRGSP